MSVSGRSHTQICSESIDEAYDAYKHGADDGETRLHKAFLAQAKNVVGYRLRSRSTELANDIVHRAMMAVKKFKGTSKLSTWFYRVAQNAVNDAIRQIVQNRNRLEPISDDEADKEIAVQELSPGSLGDLDRLRKILPKDQDEVVSRVIKGFTVDEIAAELGKSRSTIGSRKRLAISKMRKLARKKNKVRPRRK